MHHTALWRKSCAYFHLESLTSYMQSTEWISTRTQTSLRVFLWFPRTFSNLPGAHHVLCGITRCFHTSLNDSDGPPVLVIRDPSYFHSRQEYPPKVWYFPEIDISKFTFHILSDTPLGSQCIKYILLIQNRCSSTGFHVSLAVLVHYYFISHLISSSTTSGCPLQVSLLHVMDTCSSITFHDS